MNAKSKSRMKGKQPTISTHGHIKPLLSPFVQIQGQWYVIMNWHPGMKPNQNLELRPLAKRESDWLEANLEDVLLDVWARLFPNDEAIRKGAKPDDEN